MNGKQKLLLFFGILFFQLLAYLFLSAFNCEDRSIINPSMCSESIHVSNPSPTTPVHCNLSKANSSLADKRTLTIDDVTITVKSTKKYHEERLGTLLKTWMKGALNQTYVITDSPNSTIQAQLVENHFVVSNCGKSHSVLDLCCKTSKEFDVYFQTNKSWWCHFDDDTYVNVEALVQLLSNYNPDCQKIYLGRKSIPNNISSVCYGSRHTYYYFTGGSYCISRLAAKEMALKVQHGALVEVCQKCQIADDATIAIVANVFTGCTAVESFLFHSIFDLKPPETHHKYKLKEQVSFMPGRNNRIEYANLTTIFDSKIDPRGYFSLHCNLVPNDEICEGKF